MDENWREQIDRLSLEAREKLMALIDAGVDPGEALQQVLAQFNEAVTPAIAAALSVGLGFAVDAKALAELEIGGVTLSERLYANAQQISQAVEQVIRRHLQQSLEARELALAIYEGYGFKDGQDPLKVAERTLPKYLYKPLARIQAAKLKTPALKAAHLQWLEAAEAQHRKALNNALRVALEERARYYAQRIAVTEMHRAQTLKSLAQYLEEESVRYVRIKLSASHPKYDICDLHARRDAYGLGPGVYPKDKAPTPPFHPWCRCSVQPVRTPIPPGSPQSERSFMLSLPFERRRDILGSFDKARRYSEDPRIAVSDIVDAGKPNAYRTRTAQEAVALLEQYQAIRTP